MRKHTVRLARVAAVIYVTAVLLVAGCQRNMLFFPRKHDRLAGIMRAAADGLQPWAAPSGEIIGWHAPNPAASAQLIVFHGNAGCALDREPYVSTFSRLGGQPRWEVRIFEYPGYGARSGEPGKDAIIAAATEAVGALAASDSRPIYLLGESLGSGVASALAGRMPGKIAGIIFVVPYARLVEVAQEKLPWIPVSVLMRDDFDNLAELKNTRTPIVCVVAGADEVVTPEQGRKLFETYAGPKLLIELPGVDHNGYDISPAADWVRKADSFLRH